MTTRLMTEPPPAEPPPTGPPALPSAPPLAIEIDLAPEAAARLTRLPALAARREGRMRSAAHSLIWLDTPEGSLAREGLALEQAPRADPCLVQALPLALASRHPGAPAERLGPAPEEAMPLVAIAAFEGRRQAFALTDPEGPVAAALLIGKLRAVAAERPVARLTLSGPAAAVLGLARVIAAELPALPPVASLAEAARALTQGGTIRSSARGAPDLSEASTVDDALARATGHLAEAVLAMAPRVSLQAGPEPVHQMRVGLRRLRSLLKLSRKAADGPAPAALMAGLRTLLGYLGPARDWDVFLSGIGQDMTEAMPDDRALAQLLKAATARRDAAYAALGAFLATPAYRAIAWDMVAFSAGRGWREGSSPTAQALLAEEFGSFGTQILSRRWKGLARDGAAMAAMDAPRLHEMRLDAKRLRYAAELLAPLFPTKRTRRFQTRLAALQETLGLANDAIVAAALANSLATKSASRAYAIGLVVGWAQAKAAATRRKAERAWESLDALGPFW